MPNYLCRHSSPPPFPQPHQRPMVAMRGGSPARIDWATGGLASGVVKKSQCLSAVRYAHPALPRYGGHPLGRGVAVCAAAPSQHCEEIRRDLGRQAASALPPLLRVNRPNSPQHTPKVCQAGGAIKNSGGRAESPHQRLCQSAPCPLPDAAMVHPPHHYYTRDVAELYAACYEQRKKGRPRAGHAQLL